MQLHEAQNVKYKETIDKLCRAVFGLNIQETQMLTSEAYGESYNLVSEVNHMKARVEQLIPEEFRNRIINLINMDSQIQTALSNYIEPFVHRVTETALEEYMAIRGMSARFNDEDRQMLCDYIDMQVRYMISDVIRQGNLRVSFNNSDY